MKTPRVYLDTSVVGGYFDPEWKDATRKLWAQWHEGRWVFATSIIAAAEIQQAPDHVRQLFEKTFPAADLIPFDDEAEDLANQYLEAQIVPRKFSDDARHVAACVTSGCTLLASWNFKHLANVKRETGFNAINLLQGYHSVRIVSPLELVHGYDENEENI